MCVCVCVCVTGRQAGGHREREREREREVTRSACRRSLQGIHTSAAVQGLIVFDIDKEKWALDLREGARTVSKGAPADKPDLTLTITDDNFVKLVNGKLGPQQVRFVRVSCPTQHPGLTMCCVQAFLMRKLKISGSMAMAMKLQPILDAAAPKAKL